MPAWRLAEVDCRWQLDPVSTSNVEETSIRKRGINVDGESGSRMPKRSNEFQRLIALLTMAKSDGAVVQPGRN